MQGKGFKMEQAILNKLESILKGKQKAVIDMEKSGDPRYADLECRITGYKNAVDDVKLFINEELEKMAAHYER